VSRLNYQNVLPTLYYPREGPGERRVREAMGTPDATGATGRPSWWEIWDSAKRQAEFYSTYAESLVAEAAPDGTEKRDNGAGWVRSVYPPEQWTRQAALANAFRIAAQHAALVDRRWATELAVRAAKAYVAAGLPFGLFLLTAVLDDRTLRDSAVAGDLVAPFQTLEQASSREGAALRHPVQQTYLVLAAASRPWLGDALSQTLAGVRDRLRSFSLRPAGPQGVPIGDYLDIADGMTLEGRAGSVSEGDQIDYLARRLAALNRSQAASLRAAQRNRYMWRTRAAVDLETVALSGVTQRHRQDEQWFTQMSTAITDELTRDDPLAELSVWTMGEINDGLPQIRPDIITILREPDQPRRPGAYRDSYTPVPPWEDNGPPSAGTSPAVGQTRPYSARGDRLDEYRSDADWTFPQGLPDDDSGDADGGREPGGTDGESR